MIPGPVATKELKSAPPRAGRYTAEGVREEIYRVIQSGPRGTHVKVAREMNISSQQLSHRLGGAYGFSIDEIGIIADALGAPPGWPFIAMAEAEERDRAYKNRNKRR